VYIIAKDGKNADKTPKRSDRTVISILFKELYDNPKTKHKLLPGWTYDEFSIKNFLLYMGTEAPSHITTNAELDNLLQSVRSLQGGMKEPRRSPRNCGPPVRLEQEDWRPSLRKRMSTTIRTRRKISSAEKGDNEGDFDTLSLSEQIQQIDGIDKVAGSLLRALIENEIGCPRIESSVNSNSPFFWNDKEREENLNHISEAIIKILKLLDSIALNLSKKHCPPDLFSQIFNIQDVEQIENIIDENFDGENDEMNADVGVLRCIGLLKAQQLLTKYLTELNAILIPVWGDVQQWKKIAFTLYEIIYDSDRHDSVQNLVRDWVDSLYENKGSLRPEWAFDTNGTEMLKYVMDKLKSNPIFEEWITKITNFLNERLKHEGFSLADATVWTNIGVGREISWGWPGTQAQISHLSVNEK